MMCLIGRMLSHNLQGQSIIIQGHVLDSASGTPLSFATIGFKGSTIGTASNQDGMFMLRIPESYSDSIIFCSYVGYKTFNSKLAGISNPIEIIMREEHILLEEIEVKPWTPWDYVYAAIKQIPQNYHNAPFLTTNYYNEYISENNNFLKYTEGVIETYNPPYGDTARISSRIVQARRRDDLESIQFMRKRLEKRMKKEQRKAEKRGEDWEMETIDDAILSATFGGPRMILRNDPVRDTASFLNPELRKLYEYQIEGYTSYHDQKVIIIHFKSKRKYEHRKREGNIYITLDSDAIVALDFQSRIIIPGVARPFMFLFGLGATDPVINATMHYKPYLDKWYINDISIKAFSDLTNKKMFSKNVHSRFELYQSLITTEIDQKNVSKIPKNEQLKNWTPLEEQIEEDPEFWQNYSVARPSGFSNNK